MNTCLSANRRTGIAARAAISLVRTYQGWISILKPKTCRYHPSCSEYAASAIAARGLLRGSLLAAWRLLRCNPFSAGGYDPGPWAADHAHSPDGAPGSDQSQ
ncbi:MAG: membrane protein insertion efficiency factor YidD [Armatimonadota bacterium]